MSYLWADMWLWKGLFHSADESSPSERCVERWVPKSSSKHVVEKKKGPDVRKGWTSQLLWGSTEHRDR